MAETITDTRFRELRALGYTGTLADMERQRLCAKASLPVGVNLSLDDLYRVNGENQWPYSGFSPPEPPFVITDLVGSLALFYGNLGANGSPILTWTNRIAGGNDLAGSVGTQPVVNSNTMPNNGASVRIILDTTNSRAVYLRMNNVFAGKTAGEAWVVAKNLTAGSMGFWKCHAGIEATHHPYAGVLYEAFCATARHSLALTGPQLVAMRTWHVYRCVSTAAGVKVWLNDVLIINTATQTFLAPNAPIDIGNGTGAVSPDINYDGLIGYVYFRDRESTTQEATNLRKHILQNTGV